jgi:hypothetical protein
MTIPRKTPYVWPTWITKLLAHENHCAWAAWFQAHYQQYEKAPSDFPMEQWRADHNQMVEEQATALRAGGYMVYVEDENSFKLQGKNGGTLSGKPDLVAVRDGQAIVIDCKTGQRRASDQQQVLIYMWALPLYFPRYKAVAMTGRVQYRDDKMDLGPDTVDAQFITKLRHIMERVTGSSAPARTPSLQECRFCNLTQKDCPDRMESLVVAHDVF